MARALFAATVTACLSTGAAQSYNCPLLVASTFADMHDGDQKNVFVDGNKVTVTPDVNTNQTWIVEAVLDRSSCSADINFNVSGKPQPPPVPLRATFGEFASQAAVGPFKTELVFTDPSGTLAAPNYPLNTWVELSDKGQAFGDCAGEIKAVFADQHDGDQKLIEVQGLDMTISPYGNQEKWEVKADFRWVPGSDGCQAVVDFNVPGKPNPPPVNLLATKFLTNFATGNAGREFEFTDPSGPMRPYGRSGKLASKDYPLNRWVLIKDLKERTQIHV